MADVALVCMPFGPVFSPSLALSLLKAGLTARGIASRIHYFSIDFAERIGQDFYSGISTYGRPPHRHLAGEWVFSRALFGPAAGDGIGYVDQVLFHHDGDSHGRPVTPALARRLLRVREQVEGFLDTCLERLLRERPRIVGFTSVFHQHVASLGLACRIKRALPGCFVVMGGANCEGAMGAETVRQFPFVDAAVSGEGDLVFPELVERVLERKPAIRLPGVRTRESVANELATGSFSSAPMVQDMDALPLPDHSDFFEQFGKSRYSTGWQPGVFFETSRGCWWGERQHCTFCGLNGQTMAYRSKSARRALEELKLLTGSHPGSDVHVVDNILDLSYFKEFVPALAEARLGADLFYETKANLRKEQVRLLRRAGIRRIQPGIESLSDAVLKLMRKGVTALQNIQLLKWCKELGVVPHWNILWGFPGEPAAEYERMARLVPLLTHLPPPHGFGAIRLDRFSPNFFDAERLGFANLEPLLPYRHVYALPEDPLRNIAYFFSFSYREPQDVRGYVGPLARQLRRWKRQAAKSELLSKPDGDELLLFDTRPAARQPSYVLRGVERALFEGCDAIAHPAGLAALLERGGFGPHGEEAVARLLAPLVEADLVLADGPRYLALAVPLGDYEPPRETRRRIASLTRAARRPRAEGDVPRLS